jgi:hypothetical protein
MAFSGAGGFASLNKAQFDALMNQTIQNLDQALLQVQQIQVIMAAHVDGDFTAANTNPGPTGYVQADVTTMKSAFSDLDLLRTIYQGTGTQSTTKDFRAFAKLISSLVH